MPEGLSPDEGARQAKIRNDNRKIAKRRGNAEARKALANRNQQAKAVERQGILRLRGRTGSFAMCRCGSSWMAWKIGKTQSLVVELVHNTIIGRTVKSARLTETNSVHVQFPRSSSWRLAELRGLPARHQSQAEVPVLPWNAEEKIHQLVAWLLSPDGSSAAGSAAGKEHYGGQIPLGGMGTGKSW